MNSAHKDFRQAPSTRSAFGPPGTGFDDRIAYRLTLGTHSLDEVHQQDPIERDDPQPVRIMPLMLITVDARPAAALFQA